MNKKHFFLLIFLFQILVGLSQSKAYQDKKEKKIKEGSVFAKIINRKLPATILYEDKDIIAFLPLRLQAKVHVLIVPKKEIPTINDITEKDAMLLGKLFLVAKKIAKKKGIAETGYRLTMNMNEDAGQSVFHLHMHLLGGEKLGPMVDISIE
ncbi:HIT domain-containing protein [uncultured Tenacibaculum sp.]|uniref:HIT domain-containing protein n=1 Tax=uncultured Tenacibaculum sp. TaxID=174713 RepID=UPI00260C73D2|nr:HIT domain-containing protein [uncultured Tenacibaculum sp.]